MGFLLMSLWLSSLFASLMGVWFGCRGLSLLKRQVWRERVGKCCLRKSVFINLNYGHSLCLLMKQSRWRNAATNKEIRKLCFERGAGPLMKSFSVGLDFFY